MSEPPKLNLSLKNRYTISLVGTVGAGPNVGLTLLGGPITFRYRVIGAEVVFRDDTANLLQVYLFTARNATTSGGPPPPDTNLLAPFAASAFLIGEGLIKHVPLNYLADEGELYIKAHGLNGCAYPQTINVTIEIEEA